MWFNQLTWNKSLKFNGVLYIRIIELNIRANTSHIKTTEYTLNRTKSIPQVYMNEEFINFPLI